MFDIAVKYSKYEGKPTRPRRHREEYRSGPYPLDSGSGAHSSRSSRQHQQQHSNGHSSSQPLKPAEQHCAMGGNVSRKALVEGAPFSRKTSLNFLL